MRLFFFIFMFIFSGCSDATEGKESIKNTETCDIFFNVTGPCTYKNITVDVVVKKVASDEKFLQQLNIVNQDNKYTLNVTKDTSILKGDRGYISFADINFDAIPDIAITTSFGLANLYVDYWVYDTVKKKYSYLGNLPEFKINKKNKTLSTVVKISAAKYKNTTYKWQGFKLVKK